MSPGVSHYFMCRNVEVLWLYTGMRFLMLPQLIANFLFFTENVGMEKRTVRSLLERRPLEITTKTDFQTYTLLLYKVRRYIHMRVCAGGCWGGRWCTWTWLQDIWYNHRVKTHSRPTRSRAGTTGISNRWQKSFENYRHASGEGIKLRLQAESWPRNNNYDLAKRLVQKLAA